MKLFHLPVLLLLAASFPLVLFSQEEDDDLLGMLNEMQEPETDYAFATFKSTRIANGHSIETPAHGEFHLNIAHRFGRINRGIGDLFGLDQANMRFGLSYGITDRIAVGVGRTNILKTYDGYIKAKLIRQATGKNAFPVTITGLAGTALRTNPWVDPNRENLFSSRFSHYFQTLIARKFGERLSLQLSPTLVHINLVPQASDPNDIFALGTGGRFKLTKSTSLNVEYYYLFSEFQSSTIRNNLTIGFDLETGGHVFQLVFSNTRSMTENLFIAGSTGQWSNGDIHFGFNLHRTFNVIKRKKPKGGWENSDK